MEKSVSIAWQRRISLCGLLMVVFVYLIVWLLVFILPNNFINLSSGNIVILLILYNYVAPIMEIIGIVPLMRQPLPEHFMHRWVLAWVVRLLFLLVYFSQLAVLYVEIMNAHFLS